jgi:dynein heavy chain
MNICKLLEIIFKQHDVKGLEFLFVFCVIWCMGAGLEISEGNKSRTHFDKFWRDTFKIIKFPSAKTVFDYFVDMENPKLEDWNKLRNDDVENSIDTSNPITNYTVPTPDTIASQYIMKKFIQIGTPPMLVGMAGCGKTQIIKGLLQDLVEKGDEFKSQIINFNFFTDSTMLQKILESQLQKAGAGWGPEGQSKLIYFVDDFNMPQQDPYETQTAIALVRQHMDYSHWYDK